MTIHLTESQIGSLFVTYDGRVVKLIEFRNNRLVGDHWRVEIDPPIPSRMNPKNHAGWGVHDSGKYCHANANEDQHGASLKEPLAFTECPY
jgi:hypothetical protein